MKQYDYIFIGSGPSTFAAANKLKNSNKKVLILDGGSFGGVCPNAGCEPKIFLEGAVKSVLIAKKLKGIGIDKLSTIDWTKLIKQKKKVFGSYPRNSISNYQSMGFDTIQGKGKFIDEHILDINGTEYTAPNIIIATGQKPNKLPIPGSEYTLNSNDIFNMESLPKHVAFIGGGFVSMELATILSAAGSKVDIIESSGHPLKAFSYEHVKEIIKELKQNNVNFVTNQVVKEIIKKDQGYQVNTNQNMKLDADIIVDASGRIPNIDDLDLDKINLDYDKFGIIVNDHLETNINGVYAAGDVVKKSVPKLTSTAHYEGEYLSSYLMGEIDNKLNYPTIATAAFTFPQVAQVGVSLDNARKDENYSIKDYNLADSDFLYVGTNDMNAKLSLIFNNKNELVGASEVSQTAADDIDNFASIIGLKLDKNIWRDKFIPVFPALAYKTRDLIGD